MDLEDIKINDVLLAKIKNMDNDIICYVKEIHKHSQDLLIHPIHECNDYSDFYQISQQFIELDDVIENMGNLDVFEDENPEYFI